MKHNSSIHIFRSTQFVVIDMTEESKSKESQVLATTYLPSKSLRELYESFDQSPENVRDVQTKFYGWIRRTRVGGGGSIMFIDVYDGTKVGALMCLATTEYYKGSDYVSQFPETEMLDELTDSKEFKTLSFEDLRETRCLSDGCAVVVDGQLVLAPTDATQPFELQIHRLRVIGTVENPATYPIQKSTEKQLLTLRKFPFLRIRTQICQSLFRIASKLELGMHIFMDQEGVEKVDPNILTMSDCEGAGETFSIDPKIFSVDHEGKDIPVGLTVSSQLPLESSITGLKQVYTSQKSFRAEKSDTVKHLAEFLHVEYEGAFLTLDKLMSFTERLVKFVIKFAMTRCAEDLAFISSKFAPSDIKSSHVLLTELMDKPFIRIKHRDAVNLIHKIVSEKMLLPDDDGKMKRIKLEKLPKQGEDLGSEHEKLLVKYFGFMSCTEEERQEKLKQGKEFGAFVFLTHWPLKIKSFYMKQCDDESGECESFDLLAPRVGEMFGGSMRENVYEKLMSEVLKREMDIRPIQWFIDLRKSGSTPHGGWGLGFARLCMLVTGAPSVRDVVYLPVYYKHCPY